MAKKPETKPTWELVSVESSNIKQIEFDGNETCHIEFHNGGTYSYNPFPKKLWLAFKLAESKGTFFFKHVKSNPDIKATKI